MKWLFAAVVVVACMLMGAAMIFVDKGIIVNSAVCALGALLSFLLAYQMQSRYSYLNDE